MERSVPHTPAPSRPWRAPDGHAIELPSGRQATPQPSERCGWIEYSGLDAIRTGFHPSERLYRHVAFCGAGRSAAVQTGPTRLDDPEWVEEAVAFPETGLPYPQSSHYDGTTACCFRRDAGGIDTAPIPGHASPHPHCHRVAVGDSAGDRYAATDTPSVSTLRA
eukprot:ctg_1121.g576